ncbi:MAG: alpha/beta fold hydrolase [bacterium]
MNKPLFFKNKENGYNLFGFLLQPERETTNNRRGIVFCDSIGTEKLYSHRVLVNFARLLRAQGYHVFLFDYYGNGDSEGDFENTKLDTCLSDTKAAIEFLMEEAKIDELGLLGVRLGAVFASLLAAKEKIIKNLILWSPIIDVGKYINDSLRENINLQLNIYKKIQFNRMQLIEQIMNNIPVEIQGYVISKDFYNSFSQVDLKKIQLQFDTRTLVIEIQKMTTSVSKEITMLFKDNNQCFRTVVPEDPFWIYRGANHKYVTKSKVLFERTLSWLEVFDGNGRACKV